VTVYKEHVFPYAVLDMSPRFTCRTRLQVTPHQAQLLDARFEAARRVYNAVLGEMKRRLDLLRQSRTWHAARKTRHDKTKRARLFAQARAHYGFSRPEAILFARALVHAGFAGDQLGVHDVDCLAKRAYDALQRVALGKAHRVRFKGRGRLRSLESDSPTAGIRFRDGKVLWRGLVLSVRNHHVRGRHGARHQERLQHALGQRICFARLIRARGRFYVQLVLQGVPVPTVAAGDRHLGMDLNVSQVAYAGEDAAGLLPLAPGLADHQRRIRRLQRHLDRQRRANNQENYRKDGTIRPGPKRWRVSVRMRSTQDRLAELQRRQADERHNDNGRIANAVIRVGKHLKAENVSVKGWQKLWGKRIGRTGPGGCMARIGRKAASAGGQLQTFPTRSTKLSQSCICGRVASKALSERVHRCVCGVRMQRDLFSAYLANFVDEHGLHADQAERAWAGVEPHLRAAWSRQQSASSGRGPDARRGRSGSRAQVAQRPAGAWDGVGRGESPDEREPRCGGPRMAPSG